MTVRWGRTPVQPFPRTRPSACAIFCPSQRVALSPNEDHRVLRLILIVTWLALASCNQGPPYAFRLMIPPSAHPWAIYSPYWFWEENGTFDTFKDCEVARGSWHSGSRPQTEDLRGQPFPQPIRDELWRKWHSQCVPVR